ncbi:ribosomal protein S5 domain 2-like protein [Lojkania enalia]|uniref:Ribosomal RNA-processing protein 43 n=1 Tax=Lojkania enalia TaxID=147567 RepID=A0A9P4K1N0_9PLEO|nr:ribosomal protein S5 domain 2-like protein [Didymosphaeria enalia]
MASPNMSPQSALSFPRPIFAVLSPHPFLQAHLSTFPKQQLRANGRAASTFRPLGVHTGSLTHTNGSAVIRLGNTAVVCGVRAELLKEEDAGQTPVPATTIIRAGNDNEEDEEIDEGDDSQELSTLRLLVPNIELATGSAPQHIPGSAPSTFAQALVARIRALLLSTQLVRMSGLTIWYTPPTTAGAPNDEVRVVKGYWVLYIDTVFLSLDGNAFDAAWLAILAALRDTRLPHAYWDEELETILCSDDPVQAKRLPLRGLPVPSSFAVFEGRMDDVKDEEVNWVLSDPDAFEESVCRETVCVVVDCSDKKARIRTVEKNGGGVVDRDVMRALIKRAVERWSDCERALSEKG